MEHEQELVVMQVLQFEMLYGEPNHKQEKIKSLKHPHKETHLCGKWSFNENGQCNYKKISNYIFSLRLLCECFMVKDNVKVKVLFKCSSMGIKHVNPIR
jgi:hypothetical protein